MSLKLFSLNMSNLDLKKQSFYTNFKNVYSPFVLSSVVDPDSLNLDPDPDPANSVNPDPDPDPGLKKLFKNKVLKIEYKWTF